MSKSKNERMSLTTYWIFHCNTSYVFHTKMFASSSIYYAWHWFFLFLKLSITKSLYLYYHSSFFHFLEASWNTASASIHNVRITHPSEQGFFLVLIIWHFEGEYCCWYLKWICHNLLHPPQNSLLIIYLKYQCSASIIDYKNGWNYAVYISHITLILLQ